MSVTTAAPRPDPELLGQFFDALTETDRVYEVRIPDPRKGGPCKLWHSPAGYFKADATGRAAFVRELSRITGADAKAVFAVMNPVKPELLARAQNRLCTDKVKSTAADCDVTRRRVLLSDIDPGRAVDISATDKELAAALEVRDQARSFLEALGFPAPLAVGMSGNGGSLLYRIDLPNRYRLNEKGETVPTKATTRADQLVSDCLKGLAHLLGNTAVKVDTSVSNASRLTKVIGSVAAKGDHCPDLCRPWRLATADLNPGAPVVPYEVLRRLADLAPDATQDAAPSTPAKTGAKLRAATEAGERSWTVAEVLEQNSITFTKKVSKGATVYQLEKCLTPGVRHTDGAAIVEGPSGKLAYVCHHNRCQTT